MVCYVRSTISHADPTLLWSISPTLGELDRLGTYKYVYANLVGRRFPLDHLGGHINIYILVYSLSLQVLRYLMAQSL